ncbi:hypothetical protein CL614_07380 [archaeon]|nr:hypothetical protein [archaeon]
MPAIITTKFRFHNAEQFKESFSEAAATNYYLFIGRPGVFATATTGGSDSAPPTPPDNRRAEARYWDDMLAAKKVVSTGVTHAIPRRDLDTSGATIYDMWRPDYSTSKTATSGASTIFDSTFYFVTAAYRVYKILDNNGGAAIGGGSAFTAPSTDDSKDPFVVGGYTVKYMYTLSTTDVQNFLTPDFMPAPTSPVTNNVCLDGKLTVVLITTAGVGTGDGAEWNVGTDRVVTNVPIRGDGTGGLASVTIGRDGGGNDGQITAVQITSTLDSNYTQATLLAADIIEQHNIQNANVLAFPSSVPAFEVIIGPDGGHGSNPAKELGGHFILMDTKLEQTEGYDFSVVNDFRQVGIVRNPNIYGTASAFTGATARQTRAIKLASNSGTFKVDGKIYQTITPVSVSTMSLSGSTITVNTSAAHKLTTGQMVDVTGGSWTGTSVTNAEGHQGTHHITVDDVDTFSYTVTSSRTPSASSGLTAPASGISYTCFAPQGTVVEYDSSNNVLFFVQTMFDDQGTDSTWKQNIPFGGDSTITGDATPSGSATGVPDTSYSSSLNNTSFTSGYANPEFAVDSGDIIYIENRKPISRASDQTEDIKLIVEF